MEQPQNKSTERYSFARWSPRSYLQLSRHVWSGRLWYGYVTFIYVDAFYAHVQCTTLYTPYARASCGVTLVLLNTAEMQFSALKRYFHAAVYFH